MRQLCGWLALSVGLARMLLGLALPVAPCPPGDAAAQDCAGVVYMCCFVVAILFTATRGQTVSILRTCFVKPCMVRRLIARLMTCLSCKMQ